MTDDPRLPAVLRVLEEQLGGPAGETAALGGGITNRNVRVIVGGHDVVVRLPGGDTGLLGIDRDAECEATRAAAAAGVGPEVVAFVEDQACLVTAFVPGRPPRDGELTEPRMLRRVAGALRLFHDGPPLRATFSPFAVGAAYRAIALERGAVLPDGLKAAERVAQEVRPLLQGPEHEPVPCHNDLLAANLLVDDVGLTILDWEYAGMGDRYFDLANLAVNNGFTTQDETALLDAYFAGEGGATARRRARLGLMRLMSDYREAWWGIVQGVVSELDFDFGAYALEHLDRLLVDAGSPDHAARLRAASRPDRA